MVDFALQLFAALAAIPKILGYVQDFAAGVTLWYISRANEQTNREILDAASLAVRAKTQEDRHKSLDAWRAVLTRPRIRP